ncbi:expressed unknown protein [Seminavis robusta]|uniref:Uncharacterized protein n=1 Tax=Seminavis robusta TaxID=568900 RepID=A0A9N8HBV2_9STRA|nr:expressed unknown protein [Seminavis robusta]|eukprot:Sro380_g130540.1 n/a (213) ;mRNA; f:3898-4947
MFSMMKHTVVLLALSAGTCLAEPAFMRAETQPGRQLVSCSETCSVTGSCSSGNIAVCHEGKEDECIASSEWNEHCTDFGDTCGACASGGEEYFSTLNGLVQIPHDSWVHFYLTPVRVVCLGITDKPCQVMNDQGIPLYIAWGMDLVDMVHNSTSMMAQSLFLVITALMVVGFVVVEALFGATMGPVMVFSLATAYSFSRKNLAVANKKTVEN